MKKWFITVSLFLSMFFSHGLFASEIDAKNPYTLINKVATNMFSHLKANQKKYQANPELLRDVVEKELMPYINARYAALKVLGPMANKATKEERTLFTQAFDGYLVRSYAQILLEYTDQKVKIEKEKPIDAKTKIVNIRVEILDKSRPPLHLDFKLRKNAKTLDWQAFDVQVEGVSMLDAKTSEWSAQLRKNGIKNVAAQLTERAKTPLKKEAKSS